MGNRLIIYRVTNVINGKIYIGATSKSIEERKKDHLQKALKGSTSIFHKAIMQYKPENFIWVQIDKAKNLNMLALKEKFYIRYYESNRIGYNSDEGGGFKKAVFQYDYNGNYLTSFSSLKEVEVQLHIDKRRVSQACINSTMSHGYFWSYQTNDTFPVENDHHRKRVFQYDLEGQLVQSYKSLTVASKLTGLSKSCIGRCCRGERQISHGFIWKYE